MPAGANGQPPRCKPRQAPPYQMLSLSATATHGVKGWNLTTEGTPGFLFRNIWSSSLVMPVRETQQRSHATENRDDGSVPRQTRSGPRVWGLGEAPSGQRGAGAGRAPASARTPAAPTGTSWTRGEFSVELGIACMATAQPRHSN